MTRGERVRLCLARNRWSISELGRRLGTSQSYTSLLVHDLQPGHKHWGRLAEILQVSRDWLIAGAPPVPPWAPPLIAEMFPEDVENTEVSQLKTCLTQCEMDLEMSRAEQSRLTAALIEAQESLARAAAECASLTKERNDLQRVVVHQARELAGVDPGESEPIDAHPATDDGAEPQRQSA